MPWLASGGSPPETRCAAGLRNRRDILIAPPLHTAHYLGGAIGTSRPTAITHAIFARRIPTAAVCGSPPSRLALFTPAGAPGPVPCYLAGFGVQSRSMSAARLRRAPPPPPCRAHPVRAPSLPRPCPRAPGRRPHHASKNQGQCENPHSPDFFFFARKMPRPRTSWSWRAGERLSPSLPSTISASSPSAGFPH